MNYPPNRLQMRDEAVELAEVRVSALLQAFAMPNISTDQIRKLLVDSMTTTYVSGFAAGWDSALEETDRVIASVERFRKDNAR